MAMLDINITGPKGEETHRHRGQVSEVPYEELFRRRCSSPTTWLGGLICATRASNVDWPIRCAFEICGSKRRPRSCDTGARNATIRGAVGARWGWLDYIAPQARTMMSADPVAALLGDPRFKGQPVTWGVTPEGYDAVRRAWLTHVQAEEVLFRAVHRGRVRGADEGQCSAVFTDDCVMELAMAGERSTLTQSVA
jgi:hypothetical protein